MTRPPRSPRAPRAAGEVRLIGGQWKRSKLPVLDWPGLRPTPDRLRETLFNWLGQDLTGWRCLDAFAGSGALGFEAASRGAAQVVMFEREAALVANLVEVKQRLKADAVRLQRGDVLRWMGTAGPAQFELVMLDPPFDAGLHEAALSGAAQLVVPNGFVYVEAASAELDWPDTLSCWREVRMGQVHARLLRRSYTESIKDPGTHP